MRLTTCLFCPIFTVQRMLEGKGKSSWVLSYCFAFRLPLDKVAVGLNGLHWMCEKPLHFCVDHDIGRCNPSQSIRRTFIFRQEFLPRVPNRSMRVQ